IAMALYLPQVGKKSYRIWMGR
ncbi:putative membrane protein, partial [Vibrio harveyi]